MAYQISDLLQMQAVELDQLFRASEPGPIPDGEAETRCSGVHIAHLSAQMKVPDNESQPIPPTQHLCGSALTFADTPRPGESLRIVR
jgi:hypothetical protein